MEPERRTVILDKLIFASLVLLLVLTPLPYATVEVWSTTIWELWIFATTLLWAVLVVKDGRLSIAANPLALPLFALLLLALVQFLPLAAVDGRPALSYDPYTTRLAAIKLLAFILFFLLFASFVNTDERWSLVIHVVIGVTFLITLVGIGQSYVGKMIWQRGTFGPFVNRNHFAGFLEMGVGPAAALIIGRSVRRERVAIYGCIVLVLCAGLVLSGSRGGVLALVAEAVFLAVIGWPPRAETGGRRVGALVRAAATAVLFIGVVVGSLFLVRSDLLVQHYAQLQNEGQAEMASERVTRSDIWRATLRMIKDHPVMGVGLGAFPLAYTRYDPSSGEQRVEQSHNDYLQVLADAGLLGGLIALSFLVLLFVRGFVAAQTRDRHRRALIVGALAGCFALAVHSMMDFNLQITANAQLFLALAALATPEKHRRGEKAKRRRSERDEE